MSSRSEAPSFFLYQRLLTHLKTPLYRNGYFLTFSSLATSGIGLIYWIVAAHQYSTFQVGINTALISAMTFLAGIAEINLMSALIRFIPVAGRFTKRFVLYSYLVSLTVAAVISVIFIKNLGNWSPALSFLGENRTLSIWFTISTMLWCIFVLQDSVLTGLRRASWVPIENMVFSLTKIVLMLIFVFSIPTLGIFASWSVALIVAIIPTNYYIFRKLIPHHAQGEDQINAHIEPKQVIRYVAPDYLGAIFFIVCTTLMPVIVTTVVGVTANAYFYLAWTIANTLYLIGPSMGSSLIVEAVNDPQKLALYSHRVFKNSVKLVAPAALIVALVAPYVLLVFGKGYSAEGATLLRLLALSAIPSTINAVFMSVSRVQRRMVAVVVTSGTLYSLVLILSFIFLKTSGIAGVGIGWLVSQTLVASVVYFTQLKNFWLNTGESDMGSKTATIRFNRATSLIHFLYRAAAALRILPFLSGAKQLLHLRKRQSQVSGMIPEIVKSLPLDVYDPAKGIWKAQMFAKNETDTTVVFFGPSQELVPIILKLPSNPKEVETLCRQIDNLATLSSDERLGEWRNLLPQVIARGKVDGQFFFAEGTLPGITFLRMLRTHGFNPCMSSLAAAEIATLHLKTGVMSIVGMDLLEAWVNEPLKKLTHFIADNYHDDSYHHALDKLETELNVALAGRELWSSWIHGDFSPGNILINPEGSKITGIVDWDMSRPNDLPLLDLMHLLLSIRMERDKRELGHIISDLLLYQGWHPEERQILETAQKDLPGESLDIQVILLLTWLHHIDANLNKTSRYDRSSLWAAENILTVLRAIGLSPASGMV